MDLYEPLNEPKPVGEGFWVVDGPVVRMAYLGASVPFPTRMIVVRLGSGDLFLWSPIELDDGLRSWVDARGPLRQLVSPNKIHYTHVGGWKRAYPAAVAWASPGARAGRLPTRGERLRRRTGRRARPGLARGPGPTRLSRQSICGGARLLPLQDADVDPRRLIENFEPERGGRAYGWLVRLADAADPDGKAPLDMRLTFLGRKNEARASFARMLAWRPEKVIVAHGRWYDQDGTAELRRAFRWLGSA